MVSFLLGLFRLIWLFGKGVLHENLEKRAFYAGLAVCPIWQPQRPRIAGRDRWFWIALSVVWRNWRNDLVVVRPDTVVRWQRERFRRYWTHLSKRSGKPGRPAVSFEIRELIRTMALANGLWRAPRIHGELQKLGIEVSERTVSRILRTVMRPPSPIWKTFLHNHIGEGSASVAMLASLLSDIPFSMTIHGPSEFDRPTQLAL